MEKKEKVAFLTTFCDFFWDFELDNIKIVKEMGYDVVLISNCGIPERSNHKKDLECMGIQLIHIPFERNPLHRNTLFNFFKLKKSLKQLNPIAVDCHLAVVGALARVLYKGNKSVKVIYSPHGFFFYKGCPFKNKLIYKNVECLLAPYTDALITINSEDYHNALKMKVRGKAYLLNGVGVDIEKYQNTKINNLYLKSELMIPKNSFIFLSVGELNQNKNHMLILKAMVRLREEGIEDFHYVICGRGEEKSKLLSYTAEYGLIDRVHLLGYRNDVSKINKQVNVFILPSFKEGLSVSVIEAMACGLPVLASRIRGNIDLIDEGNGGGLFDPTSVAELSEKMKFLLLNKNCCHDMGNFNRKKSNIYSKDKINKQMKEIYKTLLN